jgi:hypothetical protein
LALLPPNSTAQVVALALAGVPGLLAWIATPLWFLRLGSPSGGGHPVDAGIPVSRGARS